jgi:hypothetical protein
VRSTAPARRAPAPVQRDVPCHTFLYTPLGDPWVESLVASVRAANSVPSDQVRGFGGPHEVRRLAAGRGGGGRRRRNPSRAVCPGAL